MLKKTLIAIAAVLAALVLVFVIVVAVQPTDFRISRSAAMSAPPSAIFPHVNDFHQWDAWSPWAKLDPNATTTFDGPTSGVGAAFAWSGNDKVGAGHQKIVASRENLHIQIQLDFDRPFKGTNTAEFTFKPEDDKTLVTWSMYGKNNFFAKAFSLFVDCDKLVGSEFEKGLVSLKSIVEAPSPAETANSTDSPAPAAPGEDSAPKSE